MMRTILLVTALLFLFTADAAAQDVPDQILGAPRAAQPNELTPDDEAKRKEYANAYYKRCMSVPTEGFTEATTDMTCMCHTVHMLKALKTPELELMGTGKGPVAVNPTRLAVEVYAPCVEFGIVDLEEDNCYESYNVKLVGDTQEKYDGICDCFTRGVGQLVRETAVPQLAAIAAQPQGVKDPFYDIMRSSSYVGERNALLKSCIAAFYNPK